MTGTGKAALSKGAAGGAGRGPAGGAGAERDGGQVGKRTLAYQVSDLGNAMDRIDVHVVSKIFS